MSNFYDDDDDDDDDGPNARYAFWADVLDVGGDGESTLSVAGSGRLVDAILPINQAELWRRNASWLDVSVKWRSPILAASACLVLCMLLAISFRYFSIWQCYRKGTKKEAGEKQTAPSVVAPFKQKVALNTGRRSKLVRVISSDENHPDLVHENLASDVTRQHQQLPSTVSNQVVALYPVSRIVPFTRHDSEADAEQVAGHVIAYKHAFAKAGMQVNDDTVCQIAIERVSLHEKERLHEYREYRSLAIQFQQRAQDFEHTERRHQENIQSSKEDKDWLFKLYAARDRSYTALTSSFFWLLVCRVSAGLLFQGRHVYEGGLYGTAAALLRRFSDRCSPLPMPTMVDDSSTWKAYLLSPLGGAYNYVSVASASVSRSSCYALQGVILVLVVIIALVLATASKHLPRMVRTAMYGICAIALSDTSFGFIGVWAAIYSAFAMLLWYKCRDFMRSQQQVTPTAQDLNKFHMKLDDVANASSMLPPLAVIAYSCQMAAAHH